MYADLEERLFENTNFKPYVWLRYLDDIFCIWVDGHSNLKEFFEKLNSFHQTIKFTMESSDFEVNFLDVTVSILNNTLQTDLYF